MENNTHIEPKNCDIKRLIELLNDEFIFGDRNSYENSTWGKEILRRGEEAIPHIGDYLKKNDSRINTLLSEKDREEVKGGWVMFLGFIVISKKINMNKLVTNYEQWVNWSNEFRP